MFWRFDYIVYTPPKGGRLHEFKYRETKEKNMDHPPEGMTSGDIRCMSEDDIFDMDYFLNKDDPFDDDLGKNVPRPVMEQTVLAPDAAPEFMEVSLRGRPDFCAAPAAVLHIDTVTVDLFEDTPHELLEAILKAVRSCQATSPG